MPNNALEGKWAWEGVDPSQRHLRFKLEAGGLVVVPVINGGEFESMGPETAAAGGGEETKSWFFGKLWESRDGARLFNMEAEFFDGGGPGTFVNVSEFTIIDPDRISQSLRGYRFDCVEERWIHFEKETLLRRIE